MNGIKWCGFDFGQCLMEPTNLRNPLLFGDIFKELGRPELIRGAIYRYRLLKEKYGDYGPMKEGHQDKILNYVLDGDEEAMSLFQQKEKMLLSPPDGLVETLEYLQSEGISINVVSELKKTLGAVNMNVITNFLNAHNLTSFFKEIITPQGKIDVMTGQVDPSYKGLTKEAGTLYDRLRQELQDKGIEPNEAVMIGDKPATDIKPARARGFHTIQYIGYIDYGEAGADYRIVSFRELPALVQGKGGA